MLLIVFMYMHDKCEINYANDFSIMSISDFTSNPVSQGVRNSEVLLYIRNAGMRFALC